MRVQQLHIASLVYCTRSETKNNEKVTKIDKKDGYRQQNVRQRQKLISIIDYDVCMTFY